MKVEEGALLIISFKTMLLGEKPINYMLFLFFTWNHARATWEKGIDINYYALPLDGCGVAQFVLLQIFFTRPWMDPGLQFYCLM